MASLELNADPQKINWSDHISYLFLNSRLDSQEATKIFQRCQEFLLKINSAEGFIILSSSGTTQATQSLSLKLVKKQNFLKAAGSFNEFFKINQNDVFLNALPTHHVGGLAVYARAFLSRAKVFKFSEDKWEAGKFVLEMLTHQVTRTSLVPTQIFDIVAMDLPAPRILKTVFVGGANLDQDLRDRAIKLGWPSLASYGMTEASSMLASQKYEDRLSSGIKNKFYPLPGVKISTDLNNRVFIRSPGIFSFQLDENGNSKSFDESVDFATNDFGISDGETFEYLGRKQDLIKISGELVSMIKLSAILDKCLQGLAQNADLVVMRENLQLISLPHERTENEIVLVKAEKVPLDILGHIQNQYNQLVLPFEKIKRIIFVKQIPRTDLGKIKTEQLRDDILKGTI